MEFTVKIECKELVDAVLALATAMEKVTGVTPTAPTKARPTKKVKEEAVENLVNDIYSEHIPTPEQTPEQTPTPTQEPKTVTLEEVRAVLSKLRDLGKAFQSRDLIVKYGGTKLTDVDPSKFADLLADAEAIAS